MSNQQVYMDHAATTPIRDEVFQKMVPFLKNNFGNPSSMYQIGQTSRKALDESREKVAKVLNCKRTEVIFTSGGTESDNTAIKGGALALQTTGNHIITTTIEHEAVIQTCQALENLGFDVTYLPVDRYGIVDPDLLKHSIKETTILVSLMLANNEIGIIQDIPNLSSIIRSRATELERTILIHSDAVQAAGFLDLNVKKLDLDMLSLSAHKFYGPKGVGILYTKHGSPLVPQQLGGGQERQQRAGTENIPGIVGCAEALSIAEEQRVIHSSHCEKLRDRLLDGIKNIPGVILNTKANACLPNNVNVAIEGAPAESIILGLDLLGIAASSGSACSTSSLEPSHVLLALGLTADLAQNSLRLTLGKDNTQEDVDFVLANLPNLIDRVRAIN
mgnify:FL=1|jgi:cysteine desulfurase|tara:strand:- start:3100 stop:4266 length:1167 start_codon:yes stop_codon:yes gene_type:complete